MYKIFTPWLFSSVIYPCLVFLRILCCHWIASKQFSLKNYIKAEFLRNWTFENTRRTVEKSQYLSLVCISWRKNNQSIIFRNWYQYFYIFLSNRSVIFARHALSSPCINQAYLLKRKGYAACRKQQKNGRNTVGQKYKLVGGSLKTTHVRVAYCQDWVVFILRIVLFLPPKPIQFLFLYFLYLLKSVRQSLLKQRRSHFTLSTPYQIKIKC